MFEIDSRLYSVYDSSVVFIFKPICMLDIQLFLNAVKWQYFNIYFSDFQKLEREARICRKLQHPNIGK